MIAVAIPDMAKSLGSNPLRLNLVITTYLLSLAVFIPLSGWIADRLGARVVFCAAIAIFATGSALCGRSTSLPMLLLMRVVQGFGGAMMTPVVILATPGAAEERASASEAGPQRRLA